MKGVEGAVELAALGAESARRGARGATVRRQAVEFGAVAEKEPAYGQHDDQGQRAQRHPRLPPAQVIDQLIAQPGKKEQADRQTLPRHAHDQPAAQDEPLGDGVVADQLHGAEAQVAHQQQPDQQRPRPTHLGHRHQRQTKDQRVERDQPPRAVAIHQPPGERQQQRRGQCGYAVDQRSRGARDAQILHKVVEEEADSVALARPHHDDAQRAYAEDDPAVEKGNPPDQATRTQGSAGGSRGNCGGDRRRG